MMAATENEVVDMKITLARMDEKLDGITDRLDKINGTVGRLQAASIEHDKQLASLNTEKAIFTKLVKPALLVLCIFVAGLLGHADFLKNVLEYFK